MIWSVTFAITHLISDWLRDKKQIHSLGSTINITDWINNILNDSVDRLKKHSTRMDIQGSKRI
jgi:hypothetical protein